jgi:hypothetical protein
MSEAEKSVAIKGFFHRDRFFPRGEEHYRKEYRSMESPKLIDKNYSSSKKTIRESSATLTGLMHAITGTHHHVPFHNQASVKHFQKSKPSSADLRRRGVAKCELTNKEITESIIDGAMDGITHRQTISATRDASQSYMNTVRHVSI